MQMLSRRPLIGICRKRILFFYNASFVLQDDFFVDAFQEALDRGVPHEDVVPLGAFFTSGWFFAS